MNNVQKARARLLLSQPFYATLLLGVPLIPDDDVGTACTNMLEIRYSPTWFDTLTVSQVQGILAHEVMHIALLHGFSHRGAGRDPKTWNIACDHTINLTIKASGLELPEGGHCDPKYAGWSAEAIYDDLMRQGKGGQGKGKGGQGKGGQGKGGQGEGLSQDLRPTPTDADGVSQAQTVQRRVGQLVAQAASVARMAGKLGADMERLVQEVLNPKVPWQELLREYMHAHTQDDESWARRNRRVRHAVLPSRYSEGMGEVVVIGDTSGSITSAELAQVASEVQSIVEQAKPERIRLVWADAEIAGEQVFEQGELVEPKPAGGGGTDMRVPLAHVAQYDPAVVVLVTDGYTPWPALEPSYPLIVCCTTDAAVPVGHAIRM